LDDEDSGPRPSPRERYDEFARDNENWDRKVNEALEDLDELIEDDPPREAAEPATPQR
jgi:hypothetical protein